MFRVGRSSVVLPALAMAVTACLGGSLAAAPAAQADVANSCGGAVPDYMGLLALDTPFTGTVTLPGGGTREIKISPQYLASTLLKTEITASPTDSRYAIGNMVIRTNSLGRGLITFPTYAGLRGRTTSQLCPVGTRVTKMLGKVSVAGVKGELDFATSRI
ncbi:hypothetical protein ACGFY6_33545 [Streptomyces sp. NPDC048387]|uniref:hypothetical protein n=1 Tax=Streptomyces sp. NPDC048387 TaxID=3365542 RepID=UPI00371B9DF8